MMKGSTRHRLKRWTALGAFLALAILPAACGNADKKSTLPATSQPQTSATFAGLNVCTTCHTDVTVSWLSSRHANTTDDGLNSAGYPDVNYFGEAALGCANCHDQLGDSARLVPGYTGNVARPVISCETCHGPGSLHSGSGAISRYSGTFSLASYAIGTQTVSGQFVMCTNCHILLLSDGSQCVASDATCSQHGGDHTTSDQVIWDTHYATAGTYGSSGNTSDITGYAMDYSKSTVCSDCHNPHGTADINREWAQSKHADKTAAGAWAHYNWSCDAANCGSSGDRTKCQRCHTASGVSAFAAALQSGDLAQASMIASGAASPAPVAYSADWKPEMLECRGCHTDSAGTLREPGAYTANYDYVSGTTTYGEASYTYPDESNSNVCLLCHTGRQSGDTIKNIVLSDSTVTTFDNLSFIDSHYLAAGAVMFTATGYEYERSYANPASYKHVLIGSPDAENTGSGGPCVGCHMFRSDGTFNHLYKAVEVDDTDVVTSVVSEVCYNCHAGSSSSLAATAEEEKNEFSNALAALIHQLDVKGVSFYNAYPYMYSQRYTDGSAVVSNGSVTVIGIGTLWSSASITNTDYFRSAVDSATYNVSGIVDDTTLTLASPYTGATATTAYVILKGTRSDGMKTWLFGGTESEGRKNMGAAFNLQLLEHEPGAYVHNSKYAKRLIYDSIDWIDDGSLNYSVGTTLNGLPAETTFKAGAMTYLLPSGVMNGVQAERP